MKRPLHGRFGSETAKKLTAIYLTDILQQTQVSVRVTVMWRPWSLVKVNGFILVSECLPGIISASSKAVKCIKGSKMDQPHWYYNADQWLRIKIDPPGVLHVICACDCYINITTPVASALKNYYYFLSVLACLHAYQLSATQTQAAVTRPAASRAPSLYSGLQQTSTPRCLYACFYRTTTPVVSALKSYYI